MGKVEKGSRVLFPMWMYKFMDRLKGIEVVEEVIFTPPTIGDTSEITTPPVVVETYKCKLTVYHKDSGNHWFEHPCKKDDKITDYFRGFYKWFVARPQSQNYTLYYKNGFTVFTRDMIKNFSMTIIKDKEDE